MSRVLGVDYGTKRIGLAISDDLGMTARPVDVVSRAEIEPKLLQLAGEYDIDRVVVGLPTALAGHEGESAAGARNLGAEIANLLDIEVDYVDERFTSRMAESVLLEAGMRRRIRKGTVDKVAAAIILQTYLDARSGNPQPGDDPASDPT